MKSTKLFVMVSTILFAACASPSNGGGVDGGSGSGSDRDGGAPGTDGHVADAGSSANAGDITIIVEPNGNKASELVDAINAATTSVYMTMYEIDDAAILTALEGRGHAHVDVEAVLDSSTTNKTSNTPAYTAINSAGGSAVWSNATTFMFTHEKTIIIDDKVAWIMTMNMNTSSPEYNREYLAIDTNATDIAEATAVFKADHANTSVTPTGPLVVADTNARTKLVALIASATKTLDIEVEELSDTDSNGIVDAIVTAAKTRHVATRIVIANESPLASAQMTAITDVKAAGAKIVMTGPTSENGTGPNPYIHAKAIVVDCVSGTCANGFVGSENFSAGSVGYNRELGVTFTDATQLAKVEAAISTDFSGGVVQ